MKKFILLLTLAMLMLAFPGVEGKSQNAEVKNEIKEGHHNTIVANIDQVSQIANNNNVPYGQLKKIASGDSTGASSGTGLSQNTNMQNMNMQNQIAGGHHNTIAVNGRQTAASGAMGLANNSTTTDNFSQTLNTQNQIIGGHHNLILLSSSQVALISGLSPGNLSQAANIYNQIAGGHHNVIVVGSNQLAWLNSSPNDTASVIT